MKKVTPLTLLTFVVIFVLALCAHALEVPPQPKGRVSDYTGILSLSEISSLEQMMAQFERETTNQIAVLLIPTLAGDSLEDYSIRLAEKWQIGQKGLDNGVILLIVTQDRKIRIEVGYGLEGTLPDSLAGEIIRQAIAPKFRQGRFYEGIQAGVSAIIAATKGEYRPGKRRKPRGGLLGWFWPLLFFFFLASGIIRMFHRRRYYSRRRGGLFIGGPFWWGGGFGSGGFGGGFSGGGGGFGGGGASGGW
jgi:uncharacterized protein